MLVANTIDYQALNTSNLIRRHSTNAASSVGKLSSGVRINRASDDPAGVTTAAKLKGRASGADQVAQNAQNASSVAKAADSVYSSALDILYGMRDLVSQASGADSDGIAGINAALATLDARLADLGKAKYGDQDLFGNDFEFYLGVNQNTAVTMNFDGTKLAATLSSTAAEDTQDNLATLDASIKAIAAEQAKAGGYALANGYIADSENTESSALWDAYTSFTDTDVAKEMTNYVKNSVLSQQGQLILSQYNQNAYSVLNLLR